MRELRLSRIRRGADNGGANVSKRQPTLAEQGQQAAEIALLHFRESFLLCFRAMTDGVLQQYRERAREILKFFETETDPQVWARLNATNPEIANGWLQQWEGIAAALGKAGAQQASGTLSAAGLPTAAGLAQKSINAQYANDLRTA